MLWPSTKPGYPESEGVAGHVTTADFSSLPFDAHFLLSNSTMGSSITLNSRVEFVYFFKGEFKAIFLGLWTCSGPKY